MRGSVLVERDSARDTDRDGRIEAVVAALVAVFEDRAAEVAGRQIAQGGDADGLWRAVAAHLAGADVVGPASSGKRDSDG